MRVTCAELVVVPDDAAERHRILDHSPSHQFDHSRSLIPQDTSRRGMLRLVSKAHTTHTLLSCAPPHHPFLRKKNQTTKVLERRVLFSMRCFCF